MNLRKAAEMALDALELGDDISAEQMSDALEALRQALAEGVVQEFKLYDDGINISQKRIDKTAKNRHKWVGLTDEELQDIAKNFSAFMTFNFARAIETKLKEKNE